MRRGQGLGPERFVLAVALLVPLGVMLWVIGQLPGTSPVAPTSLVHAEADPAQLIKRPPASSSQGAAPPTLAVPTPTAPPTATPVPVSSPRQAAQPNPTPQHGRTYTVKPGDELRHIAADYGVSIWKIIQHNDIANPDSLRIGEVLDIPDE